MRKVSVTTTTHIGLLHGCISHNAMPPAEQKGKIKRREVSVVWLTKVLFSPELNGVWAMLCCVSEFGALTGKSTIFFRTVTQ